MKKKIAIFLLAVLVFSFSACKENTTSTEEESVAGFTIQNEISLNVDETYQIVPSEVVKLEVANFTYSSYDTNVVTVTNSGLIKGIEEGKTTVLVKNGDLRKIITVTIVEPNKLNNISYKKLKDIAIMPGDTNGTGIDEYGNGGKPINFAWDGGTATTTANKVDFNKTSENSNVVVRTSAISNAASVDNGDYVVILSAQNSATMSSTEAHSIVYLKTTVSNLANSFRLWGWGSKSDNSLSPASGKGKFRVMAYEFNQDYTQYSSVILNANSLGSLTQGENGWIAYQDVDNVSTGHILGAPEENMFIYSIANENYNLKNKEIILAIEFQGIDTQIPDRFGIKRMGFMLDTAPNIELTTENSVQLYPNATSQINISKFGAATSATTNYTSSDSSIATVSTTGLITAKEVTERKTCTITITNSAVSDKQLTINVVVLPSPQVSFNVPNSLNVTTGNTIQVTPTNQENCSAGFTYLSLSPVIATISNTGLITGCTPGITKIKVTCGELYKEISVTVEATSLYGLTMAQLNTVGNMGATGAFPASLDFTWSGKTTADNISNDITDQKIHLYKANDSCLNDMSDPSLVNMICNISGNGTATVQNALFFKCNTPETCNEFRVWIRANEALPDISDTIYFRVVIYILNNQSNAYIPYVLKYNAVSGANAVISQDNNSGIITLTTAVGDNFVNFIPSADVLGKQNVIIGIETFAKEGTTLQNRTIVRRIGFDA